MRGPKIRIEGFRDGKVMLEEGKPFALDTALDPKAGTLDCGRRRLQGSAEGRAPRATRCCSTTARSCWTCRSVEGTRIDTRVRVGGELSDRKGLNRQGGGISAPALSDKDRDDIKFAAEEGIDYIAVSFARDAADIEQARTLVRKCGRQGAHRRQDRAPGSRHQSRSDIIEAADVVMVARGDLGVEMGYAELTGLQKTIIHESRTRNRVVITATQMMESMIQNPMPTRAEVSDVAERGDGRHGCGDALRRDRDGPLSRSRPCRRWRK